MMSKQQGAKQSCWFSWIRKTIRISLRFLFCSRAIYIIRRDLLKLKRNSFEIGVHGLKHDGKLFKDQQTFRGRTEKINLYLDEWKAKGFRAPSMHHNLEWLHSLNIHYDASTFDIDPFEPQPDGMGTIFPFIVKENYTQHLVHS